MAPFRPFRPPYLNHTSHTNHTTNRTMVSRQVTALNTTTPNTTYSLTSPSPLPSHDPVDNPDSIPPLIRNIIIAGGIIFAVSMIAYFLYRNWRRDRKIKHDQDIEMMQASVAEAFAPLEDPEPVDHPAYVGREVSPFKVSSWRNGVAKKQEVSTFEVLGGAGYTRDGEVRTWRTGDRHL